MKLDFDAIAPSVLKNFQGGQGQLVSRRYQDENNKITKAILSPGSSIGMHTHGTTSEIIFVLSGEGEMRIDDTEELLRPGDCHYCPMGHGHSLINDTDEELVAVADEYAVFGRVTPEQKVLLIKTLKENGEDAYVIGEIIEGNDSVILN